MTECLLWGKCEETPCLPTKTDHWDTSLVPIDERLPHIQGTLYYSIKVLSTLSHTYPSLYNRPSQPHDSLTLFKSLSRSIYKSMPSTGLHLTWQFCILLETLQRSLPDRSSIPIHVSYINLGDMKVQIYAGACMHDIGHGFVWHTNLQLTNEAAATRQFPRTWPMPQKGTVLQ